ncbi:pyruvate dehydrogenase E1 component beta subunit [Cutibacterium acnes JCM 18909]|nr:pyruvate dehydrogenase E1 component beta subunit [Cutibacterium acnes JCM 18909]
MGEDVGTLGGVFRITDGLKAQFGGRRVIDTPLAESGIVGTAIGMAMRGYRPCVEIQFDGFSAPAFDQIVSQLARYRARVGGRWSLPVTIRIPFGGGVGSPEHHSESPEGFYANTPGLKVVTCSNPDDAYWMLRQSIDSPDPVIFFEPKRRYYTRGHVAQTPTLGLHQTRIARSGEEATLICYGPMVDTCVEAAKERLRRGENSRLLTCVASPRSTWRLSTNRCVVRQGPSSSRRHHAPRRRRGDRGSAG